MFTIRYSEFVHGTGSRANCGTKSSEVSATSGGVGNASAILGNERAFNHRMASQIPVYRPSEMGVFFIVKTDIKYSNPICQKGQKIF